MGRFRVFTLNIHKGLNPFGTQFTLPQLREELVKLPTDLVFLQEIQGYNIKSGKKIDARYQGAQYEFLADSLWPHTAYGKNAIVRTGHHGNAILSRHAFDSWENINLSKLKICSRSLLHGVVRIPGFENPVHAFCIHLGLRESERTNQLERLAQRIRSHVPEGEAMVIAGDFNDWRGRAEKVFQRKLGLKEAYVEIHGRHAGTFPSFFPILPLDRIYFRDLKLVECRKLDLSPWHQISDHIPLVAEFALL